MIMLSNEPFSKLVGRSKLECGRSQSNTSPHSRSRRVVNGSPATYGDHPWMVVLFCESNKFRCGGSIISENFVLTAAHCIYSELQYKDKTKMLVSAGD